MRHNTTNLNHAVPHFPQFIRVGVGHKDFVNTFTSNFVPYSDFNFTSLFSWSDDRAEISILNKNLVLRMPDYVDGHMVYSVLGANEVDESILMLLGHVEKLDFVPEATVNNIRDNSVFSIVEDRDNFDYINDTSQLSTLSGGGLKKIRNKANAFKSAHINRDLRVLHSSSIPTEYIRNIEELDRHWATNSSREQGDLLSERKALHSLLSRSSFLDLQYTLIFIGDELKAFSINEILPADYAICHFEKALKDHHVSISAFLVQEVAKFLREQGVQFINWEQDLGLEGLRRSKSSYRPVKMLKKYRLKAKTSKL